MQGLGDGVLILNPSETLLFKTAAFWKKGGCFDISEDYSVAVTVVVALSVSLYMTIPVDSVADGWKSSSVS